MPSLFVVLWASGSELALGHRVPQRCSYVLGATCVSGSHEVVMECLVSSADTTAEVDSTRVEKLKMEAHNLGADGVQ